MGLEQIEIIVLIFVKTLDFSDKSSIIVLTFYIGGVDMISDKELLAKVEANEGLTVDEIKRYQQLVKPQKQIYGKYGTLKRKYMEDKGLDWTIENLPEYLHWVDKQAEDMYNVLYAKLSQNSLYKWTGEFMEDYRRLTSLQYAIEEEILQELIYTEEAV